MSIARAGPSCALRLEIVTWDEIVAKSGVDRGEIDAIAAPLRRGEERRLLLDDGHHAPRPRCARTCRRSAIWRCMRGMVGRAGCGLLPIRGHSNVQGMGSMGVTPKLKDAVFERLQNHFGVELPTTPRPRHDELHGRRRRRASSRSGSAWAAISTARTPMPTFAADALWQARPAGLSEHDAQHRPRLRIGARDDHLAGARPRRRAAGDDPGVDVQLRAAERRRPAPPRRPAERSRGDCARSPRGVDRIHLRRSIGRSLRQHARKSARRSPRSSRASSSSARSTVRSRNSRSAAARSTSRGSPRPTARARLHAHELPELAGRPTASSA